MGDDNNTLWIARDEGGDEYDPGMLYIYMEKPRLDKEEGQKGTWYGSGYLRLDPYMYPEVTFENSPQRLIPEKTKKAINYGKKTCC